MMLMRFVSDLYQSICCWHSDDSYEISSLIYSEKYFFFRMSSVAVVISALSINLELSNPLKPCPAEPGYTQSLQTV